MGEGHNQQRSEWVFSSVSFPSSSLHGGAMVDASALDAAVQDVSRRLSRPDSLRQLRQMRQVYEHKKASVETQLGSVMQTQVAEFRQALLTLESARRGVAAIEASFSEIDDLCMECSRLIARYDLIKQFNMARRNLATTLRQMDDIWSVPSQVQNIKDHIEQEHRLFQHYTLFRDLEQRRDTLLRGSYTGSVLSEFFSGVDGLLDGIASTLGRLLETRVLELCQDSGGRVVLVKAIRIIEKEAELEEQKRGHRSEDTRDDEARRSFGLRGGRGGPRQWCLRRLETSIARRFQMVTRGAGSDMSTVLERTTDVIEDLATVKDLLSPCFPPHYDIVEFYGGRYKEHVRDILDKYTRNPEHLSLGDILLIMNWMSLYEERFSLLLEEFNRTELEKNMGMDRLLVTYLEVVRTMMKDWTASIIQQDLQSKPELRGGDGWVTQAPVDLFRMINQQLTVVSQRSQRGMLVNKVIEACCMALRDFQEELQKQMEEKWKEMGMEFTCAIINNNEKCIELVSGLQDRFDDLLDPTIPVETNLEMAKTGFHDLSKVMLEILVRTIFHDLEKPVTLLLTKQWLSYDVLGDIIATLEDYFQDLREGIMAWYFKRLVHRCFESLVECYVKALLSRKYTTSDKVIQRVKEDQSCMASFFKRYLRPLTLVEKALNVLHMFCGLLDCSEDFFALGFAPLVRAYPDAGIWVAEAVLACMDGLSREKRNDCITNTKRVIEDTLTNMPPEEATKQTIFSSIHSSSVSALDEAGRTVKSWFTREKKGGPSTSDTSAKDPSSSKKDRPKKEKDEEEETPIGTMSMDDF